MTRAGRRAPIDNKIVRTATAVALACIVGACGGSKDAPPPESKPVEAPRITLPIVTKAQFNIVDQIGVASTGDGLRWLGLVRGGEQHPMLGSLPLEVDANGRLNAALPANGAVLTPAGVREQIERDRPGAVAVVGFVDAGASVRLLAPVAEINQCLGIATVVVSGTQRDLQSLHLCRAAPGATARVEIRPDGFVVIDGAKRTPAIDVAALGVALGGHSRAQPLVVVANEVTVGRFTQAVAEIVDHVAADVHWDLPH